MRFLANSVIHLIRGYQLLISPYLGQHCRFSPSCSHYALAAFNNYDFLKALKLSVKRIFKCHPWHPGGFDPVP